MVKRKLHTIVCFVSVLLLFPSNIVYSQENQFSFEHLTTKDGLSDNRIQNFCRDHKNYLWIGTTENGLNKFDGYDIKVYEHKRDEAGSLSNNAVHCIYEDSQQNLWVGTFDGLNLYHPDKDNFTVFRVNPNHSNSISSNHISGILEDSSGDVWIATENNGLNLWLPKTQEFQRYAIVGSTFKEDNRITGIAKDSKGNFWIVNENNGIKCFNPGTKAFSYYEIPFIDDGHYRKEICIDNEDNIWIGSLGGGLYSFAPSTQKFEHFETNSNGKGPNSKVIRSIIQEDNDHLLIATDQGGINRLNKSDGTFEYILSSGSVENGLNNNGILSLYKDIEGILWVGTSRGGVNYHNPKKSKFKQFRHNPDNPHSLSDNVVGCFYEDHEGKIWIGTDGGGVNVFDPQTETFTQLFKQNPKDPYSLSGDVIRSITEDQNHNVWISTWNAGLNCYDRKTGRFTRYSPNTDDSFSISDKTIWDLQSDENNNLWLGNYNSGIEVFNPKKGVIKRFNTHTNNEGALSSNSISLIYKDGADRMWICTNYGLNVYNKKTNSITIYNHFPDNNIRAFCQTKDGKYWAGSVNCGIYLLSPEGNLEKSYDKTNGLPDNTIHGIIEDNKGNLWISTKRGLSKFNPRAETFTNYDETDGLTGDNLFEQSYLKTKNGEIYVGGYNGFSVFHPDSIQENTYVPQVYIQTFSLSNTPVHPGDTESVLEKAISETEAITLKWNQTLFSFGFTAINYTSPEKNQFAYRMDGFDLPTDNDGDGWNYIGNKREAYYTNLDPGAYVFRVKASNNDGIWNEEGASVKITILPPIWKTKFAYVVYVLLISGLILLSWRIVRERERLKHHVELEKQKALRERELDLIKIKFFTNISHEFRTPLTLILAPIEDLLLQEKNKKKKQYLQLISRNSKRLLTLINQLLDFRKMEAGQIELQPALGDIVSFTQETMLSFSDLATHKNIRLTFHSNTEKFHVYFDNDKLEKILLNLLSNAFKFTTENGRIDVLIDAKDGADTPDLSNVRIQVQDTGIGIPADKLDKIFTRFFQNEMPENILNQGSGIGLAITHEFVQLHGGSIHVHSKINKGSCFTIDLPLKKLSDSELIHGPVEQEIIQQTKATNAEKDIPIDSSKPLILLVEDNEDFRFYLKDNLKQNYQVIEASNGKDGWEKATDYFPDLIISDVIMPEMDGIELCKIIKSDKRTCHVPVILLTAKASSDNQVEGLKTGADDYLAKPFYFEILESRIQNLIKQREILRDMFQKQFIMEPSEMDITPLDEQLLQKALGLIEQNMDNAEYSVSELSAGLGMSRAHLYKKLMTLTGKSPIEFIRSIRLKRATQLLKESQLSIAEIAYKVGFNNPKLFTGHFKKEYNLTPSQYIKRHS